MRRIYSPCRCGLDYRPEHVSFNVKLMNKHVVADYMRAAALALVFAAILFGDALINLIV